MLISMGTVTASTITVDDSGTADYTSIQAAVDAASPGDTILVYPGTYTENIDVLKELIIVSESGNPKDTQVQAANYQDHVFYVNAKNVTISGFNISGANSDIGTPRGIYVYYTENCTIKNNELLNNVQGISLWYSNNNTVSCNLVTENAYGIIATPYSSYNIIENNEISFNQRGIQTASGSNYNYVANNKLHENFYGIYVLSHYNAIVNNEIHSNKQTGYYVPAGILIMYGNNNLIYNNYFNNTINAVEYGSNNVWNITKTRGLNIVGGPYLGGNYWTKPGGNGFSDTCPDVDEDGIGDKVFKPFLLGEYQLCDYLPLVIWSGEYTNTPPTVTLSSDMINENGIATIDGEIDDPDVTDAFDVTINWGDGNSESIQYPEATTAFSISHQYLDDDPSITSFDKYTVAVTVIDDYGDVGSVSSVVTVNNVAPVITSLFSPIDPIAVNESVAISPSFTDEGTLDTHTLTIDWGDSSINAIEFVSVSSPSTDQTTHTYLDAGVYGVTVTVTDDDSGFDTMTSEQYIVVYDSDGGFVTGGGWIDSPSGAYTPDNTNDEDLIGKATFGFVSKYKKGANVPTGNTEFQFKVADLNFKSTSYDWLVIAASKAQYKGTGTINGEGNYGFMLTAIDAELTPSTDVDLFRIKICDRDNNDEIVYDNMLGADETGDPTTAIQGGSIKIHKEK